MLYFSETDWTLPDMADVSEEFDRTCDLAEYEKKIARLIKNAGRRTRKDAPDECEAWWAAIRLLNKEDHYLLVMVQRAGLRPRGDGLEILGTGFAIAVVIMFVIFAAIYISNVYNVDLGKYWPSRDTIALAFWAIMASVTVGYLLLRLIFGARKIDDFVSNLMERLFRRSEHEK